MKVFQINTVYNSGSTGRIVADLKHMLEENGHECFVAYGRGNSDEYNTECVSNKLDLYHHALMTRLTDKTGFYSKGATKKLIKRIEEFQPDIIHLHNIHGYFVNIEMLFQYLKKINKPVVWTLHDCWPFTGHCAYFDMVGCNKWKEGCVNCPASGEYPKSLNDNSEVNYKKKKMNFTAIDSMTLITPSKWLAKVTKDSFLGKYTIRVINNGIDINIFKPTNTDVRNKYNIGDKKIILGVANIWDKRKGFNDFIELSKSISDDMVIVLVGLSEKQINNLPSNIIGITRTESIEQLVELYSSADVYFNASVEETMGLTTIEALMSGVPVVAYDKTAVPEFVPDEDGIVVKSHDIKAVVDSIGRLLERNKKINTEFYAQLYDKNKKYSEYLAVYEQILK